MAGALPVAGSASSQWSDLRSSCVRQAARSPRSLCNSGFAHLALHRLCICYQ
jgi:hypothetical protein